VPDDKVEGPLLTYKLVRCSTLAELEQLVESRKSILNAKHIAAFAAKVCVDELHSTNLKGLDDLLMMFNPGFDVHDVILFSAVVGD
jgi:hypothetical protein